MNNYPWLDEYLRQKPGCVSDFKVEWGWQRYQVGEKMFAATCRPDEKYREYGGKDLLTLKCEPLLAEALRAEHPEIMQGFYMDKRCWISVCLDGALDGDVLRGLCDRSYDLVFGKLTKKRREEILAGA